MDENSHFSFMPKIITILRSCSMKIFSKFPTINISKLNFWLVICIAKNNFKDDFQYLDVFAPSDSRFSNIVQTIHQCKDDHLLGKWALFPRSDGVSGSSLSSFFSIAGRPRRRGAIIIITLRQTDTLSSSTTTQTITTVPFIDELLKFYNK